MAYIKKTITIKEYKEKAEELFAEGYEHNNFKSYNDLYGAIWTLAGLGIIDHDFRNIAYDFDCQLVRKYTKKEVV